MTLEEIEEALETELTDMEEGVAAGGAPEVMAAVALARVILVCKRTDVQVQRATLDLAKQMVENCR